jgi:hypothetical protein
LVVELPYNRRVLTVMKRIFSLLALTASSFTLSAQYPGPGPYPNQGQFPGPNPNQNQSPYPNQGAYSNPNQQPQGQQPPQDDQPGQPVARLSIINGDASVLRGDSGEWTAAVLNAPLVAGDSVSVPPGSRAELQLDNGNFLRINGDSEIRIAAFEGNRTQIQLSRGTVTWRSLRDSSLQAEISTPVVAVHPLRLGAVRIEVMPDGSTRVVPRRGEAEASTSRGTERIHEGSMMLVRGAPGSPDQAPEAEYQMVPAPPPDYWDGWSDQRDSYLSKAQSNRYVSPDVYGAEDLDSAGRWGYDPAYGNVWTPDVPDTWAPYRDGNWAWSDPYGWTWVDAAPWGWAPFHYGSWYFRTGFGWSWFPGSRFGHYWYHPAMVGFFGFGNGFANIGWVPLAPFEIFHPWYGRGIGVGAGFGFGRNLGVIGSYRNAGFATGLAANDFRRGAFGNHFVVNRAQLQQSSIVRGALPVNPTAANRAFTSRPAVAAGPRASFNGQSFFSRQNPASSMARQQPAPQQASGWQRFGQTPARTPGNTGAQSGAGWDRFGSPARTGQPQAPSVAPQGGRSSFAGGDARSLQVAPPIVRQRPSAPAPAPSYNRGPAPSFNRPAPSFRPPSGGGFHGGAPSRAPSGGHSGGGTRSGR